MVHQWVSTWPTGSSNYTRGEFLTEFHPDPADKVAIAAGMKQLRAEQRPQQSARACVRRSQAG
jgi:hypothetical protein